MHITLEKAALEEALQTTARAVASKSPLPVLSHIKLEATGHPMQPSHLTLTATDLDLGIGLTIGAEVTVPGSLTIPARLALEIVGELPAAPVTLQVKKEGHVEIRCGRSKFEVKTLPAEEFPSPPALEAHEHLTLPHRVVRDMVKRVSVACAASDESRAVMTGILVSTEGSTLRMVATDGRRLALYEHELAGEVPTQQVIVPGRSLQELARVSGLADEALELRIGSNYLFCGLRDLSLHSRILEGQFPDYKRVMPVSFQRRCRLGREALLGALKRMLIVAQERQSPNLVVLEFSDETLRLSANTPDTGSGSEELPVIYEGEDLRIAFNGRYTLDMLQVLECDEVELHLQDDTRSAVLQEYGAGDFRYVLMPVKLREAVEA